MFIRFQKLFFLSTLLIFNSCKDSKDLNLIFFKFEGLWRIGNSNEYEQWIANKNGTFTSKMLQVNGNDTLIMEEAMIFKQAHHWIFETIVKNQNNGKAIQFTSSLINSHQVVFQNEQHDFPKVISYSLDAQNNLRAFITNHKDSIEFNFTRVK